MLGTRAVRPSTTSTGYMPLRWVRITGGNDVETVSTLWPFASSNWKSFRVRLLRANENGTTFVQRQKNGVDVGSVLSFTGADVPPITKSEDTIIAVTTGDRLAVRFVDTDASGSLPWINTWSFIEFADGLWGY